MTGLYTKKQVDEIIARYITKLDDTSRQLETAKIKAQLYDNQPFYDTTKLQARVRNQSKKIKNMRKTVKQQGKCIKRLDAKIAELNSKQIDSRVLDYVVWSRFAEDEFETHKKIKGWLVDSYIDYGIAWLPRYEQVIIPVFNKPSERADQILNFESRNDDFAMIVTENEKPKKYSVNGTDFVLANVWHEGVSLLGWIPVGFALTKYLRMQWIQ